MKQSMRIGMVLLGALTVALWFGISSVTKKKRSPHQPVQSAGNGTHEERIGI